MFHEWRRRPRLIIGTVSIQARFQTGERIKPVLANVKVSFPQVAAFRYEGGGGGGERRESTFAQPQQCNFLGCRQPALVTRRRRGDCFCRLGFYFEIVAALKNGAKPYKGIAAAACLPAPAASPGAAIPPPLYSPSFRRRSPFPRGPRDAPACPPARTLASAFASAAPSP